MAGEFEASVVGVPPVLTIGLRGDLTSVAGNAVSAAYQSATQQGARSIVVDFRHVAAMNSGGISFLIAMLMEARDRNQRLLFSGLTAHYQKILTMMGLLRYVPVFSTDAEARQAGESEG